MSCGDVAKDICGQRQQRIDKIKSAFHERIEGLIRRFIIHLHIFIYRSGWSRESHIPFVFDGLVSRIPFEIYNDNQRWQFVDYRRKQTPKGLVLRKV
jgi:hypothetical protein